MIPCRDNDNGRLVRWLDLSGLAGCQFPRHLCDSPWAVAGAHPWGCTAYDGGHRGIVARRQRVGRAVI